LVVTLSFRRHPIPRGSTLAVGSLLVLAACGAQPETAVKPERRVILEEPPVLAFSAGGVPLTREQAVEIPTSGPATKAAAARGDTTADAGGDLAKTEADAKDYWAAVPFDRASFDEVRKFVRDSYIELTVDETRALAEAASFALASDEEHPLLLLPEAFYQVRKDHPDEKGRLKGKTTKLVPASPYLILEPEKTKEEDDNRRLSDDEIRVLRKAQQDRARLLDESWAATKFGHQELARVMDYARSALGKDPKWSMKRAWVAAAQGYLYALDPHSSLIPKEAWEDSTKEVTDSSFEGIGAILTRRPGSDYTIVESPIDGQPAVKAGLRAGDEIMKVDGVSIKDEILSEVVRRIRGPKGSQVKLTVRREGVPDPLEIGITRDHIDIKNVQGRLVEQHPGLGYIKLTGFVPTTDDEMERTYRKLAQQAGGKLRGLVLDLRGNSGGLLKEGIKIADRFVAQGTIVTVKSRRQRDEVHGAKPEDTWDMPLVVLVDDGAASASEIVASAIQENDRGLVVGDRTFGKASVQTLFSPLLRDDYYIKLTVARYYSPKGRTLQVIGVVPDVEIPEKVDQPMPLGFREENLTHHLAPLDATYRPDSPYARAAVACADQSDLARKVIKQNPNPAVAHDYQLLRGADILECAIQLGSQQAGRWSPADEK
jgi:C-terminal peptidase prc